MTGRILVCDPIAEDGIALLKQLGAEVDVRTGLSSEELLQAVDGYDGLIVRSETRLTREGIEAAGGGPGCGPRGRGGRWRGGRAAWRGGCWPTTRSCRRSAPAPWEWSWSHSTSCCGNRTS